MSKETTSESTSSSGSAQRWAQPFAKQGVNASFGVYNQAAPNLQRLTGNANVISDQLQSRFGQGNAGAGVARQHWMDTVQRGPQAHPLLDAILAQTRGNIANDVNSQFSLAGRYGSGAHTGSLTRELANAENAARFQDFNTQQGRMDQAAAALTGANQGEAAQALGSLGVAAELPYTGTNALAQQLAALFGGGTSKSVQYGPNPIWGALGSGLGAAGAISDRRLKRNIVEVGRLPNGLTVYDFTYRHDPEQSTYRGVMADEVKDRVPEAYIPDLDGQGHAGVNYALVGMPLLKVAA